MSIEKPVLFGSGKMDPLTRILENLNKKVLQPALKQSRATPIASKLHPSAKHVKPKSHSYVTSSGVRPPPLSSATRIGVYDPDVGFTSEAQLQKATQQLPKPKPFYTAPVAKKIVKELAKMEVPAQIAQSVVEPEPTLPTLTISETNFERPQENALMRETLAVLSEVPELQNVIVHVGEKVAEPADEDVDVERPVGALGALATDPLNTFTCRVGTKEDIAKWLCLHMPPEALQTYVEPFIGGGAIYLVKQPAPTEAINDWNYSIVKQWKTYKGTTPTEMISEWRKDKDTRAYVKTALLFRETFLAKDLNLKKFINMKISDKGASAEKKKFGKLPESEWASKLNGNKLRYEAVKASIANRKFKDLKTDKVDEYSEKESALLYALYRSAENLLDQTRANKLDIDEYTGSGKAKKAEADTLLADLKAENLPNMTMPEWLRKCTTVVKNPDPEATAEEAMVLKGKSTLVDLIYEKIRSCGGFGGSGVINSSAMIKFRNGEISSPVAKIPMTDCVKFLLSPTGGLDKYNNRLKNTAIYNGDYYKLVTEYDSPNTFFMLDPPYEATGGYGNKYAFNFEAFVKAMNGIADPQLDRKNPKIKGKVLITINGGDRLLVWFRKYARKSGIKWYALKAYVRQKAGGGGYRYEIFYANYKFDERAEDVLSDSFRNNYNYDGVKEEDESQFRPATDDGAIWIDSNGKDSSWSAFKASKGAVGHFDKRNVVTSDVAGKAIEGTNEVVTLSAKKPRAKKAVAVPTAEPKPKAPRKPRAKKGSGSYGGYYGQNQIPHQGSYFGYTLQREDDDVAEEPRLSTAEPIAEGGSPYESGSW